MRALRLRPAPNEMAPDLLPPTLRGLRAARGLTLDGLAAATGLDKGYLSRVERGQKAPSIATVLKLSTALGVPVGELFGQSLAPDAVRVTRAAAVEPGQGFTPLTPGGGAIEAFLLHPGPDFPDGSAEDPVPQHDGHEVFHVLAGRVELRFADRDLVLDAGDTAQFAGHLPHLVRRVGTAPAIVLVAVAREK
ncbi:helix-turn-helix domain-containing protein [Humitalea sp. 24SJ18S-53]|uniref:helix-turn-helix domain-containing protein n=1 Tax=Humitalea sp. 24SJ18S-53 TaxID=3422307 RepID=UPI003D6781F4